MLLESGDGRTRPQESRQQWREWMRDFGAEVRRVRKLLGLSQEELGRQADVSQGAVSRLEAGKGLNVPLVAVLKVDAVLAAALGRMDQSLLDEGMRRLVKRSDLLALPTGALRSCPAVVDSDLERLVASWSKLPKRERQIVVAITEQLVAGTRPD